MNSYVCDQSHTFTVHAPPSWVHVDNPREGFKGYFVATMGIRVYTYVISIDVTDIDNNTRNN